MKESTSNRYSPVLLFLLGISFVACYGRTFLWLNYKYSLEDSYYSHGYLIPLISLYLVYRMRGDLAWKDVSSSLWGLFIIVLASVGLVFSAMSDINFLSGFTMLFYLFGCSLYLLGKGMTRKLLFPLLFLLFMLPIPDLFINRIGLFTKSLSTDVGLAFVSLFDIPHLREGFRITLPGTTLVVGTPCNGMKSLISFAALGLLYVYMFRMSAGKSLLLMALIYPLAVFMNGLRIAALVVIANRYGIEKASPESFLHDATGISVFIVGLFLLFGVIQIMKIRKRSVPMAAG